MKRQTLYTLLVIVFILSFFVTPLGDWAKRGLMRLNADNAEIIATENQKRIPSYHWRLRDAAGKNFDFSKSKGRVAFIHFWATWHTPSTSELTDIQKLYETYQNQMDFYIVTNEERFPVEKFMDKKEYTFPVTYRIVDEPSPISIPDPSGAYLINRKGDIVIETRETQDWFNEETTRLLDSLIASPNS